MDEVQKADDLRLSKETVSALKAELGEKGSVIPIILSFSRSLFDNLIQSDDFVTERKELIGVIRTVFGNDPKEVALFETVKKRLDALLQPWGGAEARKKREWLETGILKSATEFASFVDLRPDFSLDRTSIRQVVPMVIVEVITRSDTTGKDSFHFQMNRSAVGELKALVDDIELKLSLVERVYLNRETDG